MTERLDLANRAREVLGEDEWNRLRRRWWVGGALNVVAGLALVIATLYLVKLGIAYAAWKLLLRDAAVGQHFGERTQQALRVPAIALPAGALFFVLAWRADCAIMRRAAPLLEEGYTEKEVQAALRSGGKSEER